MYHITIFKNRFDNQTDKTMDITSWENFKKFFYALYSQRYDSKEHAPLISSASYKPDTTRANANVTGWSPWCALDIDDLDCTAEEVEDVILSRFNHWDFICHSTGSCTLEKAKCRVIVRLDRGLGSDEISHFWFAINKHIGSISDRQTKDLSRMFYVPGKVDGAYNFMFHNDSGDGVDVDGILKDYPYIEPSRGSFVDQLPEGIRNQLLDYRKEQLTNTRTRWTSYKDCPYFPKKLATEYVTGSQGFYLQLYRMMVALACNAHKDNYPITSQQIAELITEFDRDNGNWYEKRPIKGEAEQALKYAYSKGMGF